ncbi:Sporulation-specific protein 71 [Pseudozyma hubeiensis]|nr:Sporulation-specific protein 71 [Pseudozyma hubeiensis]
MTTPSPSRPSVAHTAFEPPRPPPHHRAKATASHFASSSKLQSGAAPASRSFPPSGPRCLKCHPMPQHSQSSASTSTAHPTHSSSLIAPPHHVTIRRYIGPLPVPATAARAIAKAIAEDCTYNDTQDSDESTSESHQPQSSQIGVEPQVKPIDYRQHPSEQPSTNDTSTSHTWTDPFRVSSTNEDKQFDAGHSSALLSTSPKGKQSLLPPPRPRIVDRDPSSASVLSNASFVSAHSIARSALSDTDTAQRGQTIFDQGQAQASPSHSRSVSPSKRRFMLAPKKSNQSFPVTAIEADSLKPPTSILRNAASFTADSAPSAARPIHNARSADNLRVNALRHQRRIGSDGSRFPTSPTSPHDAASTPVPILDLPLTQIEEAIHDSDSPQQQQQQQPQFTPNDGANSHQEAQQQIRRTVNASDDTTIIRSSADISNAASAASLKPKASFSSRSEGGAAETVVPNNQSLLHPAWEQASSPAVRPTDADARGEPHATSGDVDPLSSPTKPSRNVVGRGLPIKKRSLTFTGEPAATHPNRTSSGMHPSRAFAHPRDFSRQSRMSRASTVGTFNTVGTMATEGSFGATAATSSSLARKFLAGGSFRRTGKRAESTQIKNDRFSLRPTRTEPAPKQPASGSPTSVRTRKTASPFAVRPRRTARSTSYASLRRDASRRVSANPTEASLADSASFTRAHGVRPGAVGTSGGGTKWVGESFQIGQRFWDILDARRDELQKSQPCSCDQAQASLQPGTDLEASSDGSLDSREKQTQNQAAHVQHLKRSPDGVITLLAQEAQDISDDKGTSAPSLARHASASSKVPSDNRLKVPQNGHALHPPDGSVSGTPSGRRSLTHDESAATIQTIQPDETTPSAIEARQGWNEIVSKMSSITGELSNGRKARKADRKTDKKSLHSSQSTPREEILNGRLGDELTVKSSDRNGSPRLPTDSDLRIMARSSSLVESDRSSTASKSVYASLNPSTHVNGVGPRASSLASGKTPAMTRSDALSHPAPPASVEASNPELVHQLLRRKSDLGEGPGLTTDAASDHAIAARPVASPINLTPAREIASPLSGPLLEQDPLPLDVSPSDEAQAPAEKPSGLLKAIGISTSPERKKTVKFDTGSTRPALKGRFTASLFAGKAEDGQNTSTSIGRGTAGDAQPRPPAEVLARPQPHALQMPMSGESSTPGSEVCESETSIITRKTVLKKDRMLVKIAWTPHEDLPSDFDELQARKYTIREEEWREFVVVFRMGKLELWSDPTLTNKLIGHGDRLKLRLTIPLSRGSTFVSLYSPIDRIFCLTFQPWKSLSAHHNKRGIHLRRQGTDIVLFDCRARSAAADWMWELWRELGGLIPETLEVHVPSFGLKVRIPVPESMPVERPSPGTTPASQLSSEKAGLLALSSVGQTHDGGEGFKLINRNNVIAMVWKLFCRIQQWRELMSQFQERGARLELAWRRGTELDWVINERTVENEPRHWAVLCGALLRDFKQPSILELRAAAHYPTSVLAAPGQYMQEPPAVEGFLWRVKPVSGALTRLYFTTYDGHIYICRITRAFPPDRHLAVQMQEALDMRVPRTSGTSQGRPPNAATPATRNALTRALAKFVGANKSVRRDEDVATLRQNVLEAISYPAQTEQEFQGQIEAYQSFERRRQFEQVRGSDGFIDLKQIHTIKTIGSGPVRCPGEDDVRRPKRANEGQLMQKVKEDLAVAQRDGEESDEDDADHATNDVGGQEGLELAEDANDVRRARQIEITLTNGKTIRLEAFSASVAREWVERIAELVKYWRRRERADAAELMYASGVDISELHKQLAGLQTHASRIEGVDEQKLSPMLGNIWNWCQIEGCRGIIRSGRLFHKKSSYSAFKARDYVLIAGRLLCFKLVKSVRTTRARQNNGIFHRRQDTVIHLRDAYVYSGKLSEDMLKNGRSDPAQAVSGIGGGGSNSGKRHRVPRVYADGMFSVDDDEDCTFVIRYRPERVNTPADPSVASLHGKDGRRSGRGAARGGAKETADAQDASWSVPRLDDKAHKCIAMRARSKVERDLWVRCITYEIEKIVRDDVEREKKLKNTGKVDHK